MKGNAEKQRSQAVVVHSFRASKLLSSRTPLVSYVATLWMVMMGGEAENQFPEPNLSPLPPNTLS